MIMELNFGCNGDDLTNETMDLIGVSMDFHGI